MARLLSWRNQVRGLRLPILIAAGVLARMGATRLFFVVQSWMAFTLLEAGNYASTTACSPAAETGIRARRPHHVECLRGPTNAS